MSVSPFLNPLQWNKAVAMRGILIQISADVAWRAALQLLTDKTDVA